MYRILTLLIACFYLLPLSAQTNSLVWKVSGNGLKKDSYLFGTIHMACEEDFRMNENAKAALGKVEQLVFELDISKQENLAAMGNYLKPDPSYFEGFDPAKRQVMDSILTSRNLPPQYLDAMSPAGVISLLTLYTFSCSDPTAVKGMETELLKLEEAKGKPVAELETVDFQFGLMNSMIDAEGIYQFLLTMDQQKAMAKTMVDAYFKEDLQTLGNLFKETSNYMSQEKLVELLDKRNEAWVAKMPTIMKEKASLFSVGAGHLVGEKGVINLLKKKGYKVTPLRN